MQGILGINPERLVNSIYGIWGLWVGCYGCNNFFDFLKLFEVVDMDG
jgi:hypothetical protein